MKRITLLILSLGFALSAFAQTTLRGVVRDSAGEPNTPIHKSLDEIVKFF